MEANVDNYFIFYWVTAIQGLLVKPAHVNIQVFAVVLTDAAKLEEDKLSLDAEEFGIEQ